MVKGVEQKQQGRKKPAKTLMEKRAAKRAKREGKSPLSPFVPPGKPGP